MKVLALMITALLLLASCSKAGRSAQERILEIRAELIGAERLVFGSDITADYGDRVYEFSVKFTGNSDGGTLSISAPEEIAGITAEVTLSDAKLVYDGVSLETGTLTGGGLTPAGALPVLIGQWRAGHINSSGFEKLGVSETVVVTTDIDETASQKTWFDIATGMPIRAEISENGQMVIACVFSNVVVESQT